ncbi:ECF family RNA polymerase sigma factor [Sorangium cellulosum]|jgi:RNA polymerase sigma-70 factor (ECF subfamily)|uniref:ECF family RNA polymerase sigma factor n=1 Tax=Sorangium cellulosum TaxID=56 RepID=A0A4P2QA76_SORCE|nr:RNA polymerase sigma factor [Sorangium cellulosum]AUX26479.1 ECF family RNA polymerase sigma factor [Sorangium cellulosum]
MMRPAPVLSTAAPASPDLERMRRAGAGDAAAQAWLMTQVISRVRRIARAFVRTSADADDAAQLALLAILESAATYRGEAAVEAWARRIAVRTVLRYARQQRRDGAPVAPESAIDEELVDTPRQRPGEALPREVREYLDGLPEAQRDVIILHHALEYSIEEIAGMTEVSPDTVKSRLRLGIGALRKQVRQDIAVGRKRAS